MRLAGLFGIIFLFSSLVDGALADSAPAPSTTLTPGKAVTIQVLAPAAASANGSAQSAAAASGSGGAPKPQVTKAPASSTAVPVVQIQLVQVQQQKAGELSRGNEVGTLKYALRTKIADDPSNAAVCIPPDTPVVARPHQEDAQQAEIVIDNERRNIFGVYKLWNSEAINDCDDGKSTVNKYKVYLAQTSAVANSLEYSQMVMGVLVVPFKYYVNGDRSFVGNPSLAGYVGTRVHDPEFAMDDTFAFIAGVVTVSVASQSTTTTTNSNTSTTTTPQQSAQGFTIGAGEFFSFGSNSTAQAGFMVGQDYVSKSANWINNGKTWVALDIAYQFY